MAQPTLLCRSELGSNAKGALEREGSLDGPLSCDMWGAASTQAPCDSPSLESQSSSCGTPFPGLPLLRTKNTFLEVDEESTPKGQRTGTWQHPARQFGSQDSTTLGSTMDSQCDTPRQKRPMTEEQWPEYGRPQPQPMQSINLCQAVLHPSMPSVPECPPGCVPISSVMAAAAAAAQVPLTPWACVNPMAQAMQHQVAFNAAMTAALCFPQAYMPMAAMPAMEVPQMPQTQMLQMPQAPGATVPEAPAEQAAAVGQEGAVEESRRRAHGPRRQRLWLHIYLHMFAPNFDQVPKLIGKQGKNTRKIAAATGAKVRIRGQGSGHMELEGQYEAPTPLMVAVTTDHGDPVMFRQAIEMTLEELQQLQGRFHNHCSERGITHTGPCFSIGVVQKNAQEALGDLLNSFPQAPGAK
ncbi:unnamed protein product [Effrenium voratum]|nr:unnamed protein product [Effrenium voratum]|eukprot:CAMPEP_0181409432 /NCGR_PEP_ID=MMETSP1110-20121109/6815_1 /TAXON_ID=174948 /ORGANISM="Symbiodinium sp., Strain CCMP421" /LENGTH=409 /DNA_ID=CAMNT_0023531937 /DNA_START=76 /DNA_END=1305 /DNA_ORIENTATION=+